MWAKIFLALCITVATSGKQNNDVRPLDVFDEADAIVEKYRNTVANLLLKASSQFVESHDELLRHGQAIYRITQRLISITQREYIVQVEDLEKNALDQNLDPYECTRPILQQLYNLPKGPVATSYACVNSVTGEMDHNLRLAFSRFNNLNETVQVYVTRLEKCKEDGDTNCALTLISQLTFENDMLPVILEGEIREVLNQFANLDLFFQDCFSAPTQQVFTVGTTLVQTARDCIRILVDGRRPH